MGGTHGSTVSPRYQLPQYHRRYCGIFTVRPDNTADTKNHVNIWRKTGILGINRSFGQKKN